MDDRNLPLVNTRPDDEDTVLIRTITGDYYLIQYTKLAEFLGNGGISALTTYITQTGNLVLPDYIATDGVSQDYVITGNSTNTISVPTTMLNGVAKWQNGNGVTLDNTKVNYVFTTAKNGYILYNTIKTAIPTAPDVTAPVLQSASTNSAGTIITLTYNEALSGTPTYTVSGGKTISSQVIAGSTVVITVTVAYVTGNVITISGGGVTDASGNVVANLSNQAVVNNVAVITYKFYEDFNRANTTDIAGSTPAVGGVWVKEPSQGSGTIGIASNVAVNNGSSSNAAFYRASMTSADVDLTFKVVTGGDTYLVHPSFVDNNNRLSVNSSGSINQVVGGSGSALFTGSSLSVANDIIRLVVSGTNLIVYRNGTALNGAGTSFNIACKGANVAILLLDAGSIDNIIAQ